jgi:hypothetical protein
MARTRTRKRTVQFFEVQHADGSRFDGPLPWVDFLASLALESVRRRRHAIYAVDHWCQTYTFDGRDHLIMARLRDESVSSFNTTNGDIVDVQSEVGNPHVELSIASFLPDTNILGFVLGSQASSRVKSLEEWINEHKVFSDPISIAPLLSLRSMEKINEATEAKLLQVRFERDQLSSLAHKNRLTDALQVLEEAHGSVDIELTLRVKGKVDEEHTGERRKIGQTAKSLIGSSFSRASAELVSYNTDGKPVREYVDFLNDVLAKKMDVSVKDDEGNPVRIPSALAAIDRAATELSDELEGR